MKLCRKIPMYLLLIAVLLSLSACGGKRPEATTVYVDKDGKLKQTLVDPSPDYALEKLQAYTENRITSYLKGTEDGEVRLNSCKEEDGFVYMELSYGTAADYAAFNGMECFCGTLEEASAAGMVPAEPLQAPDGTGVDFAALLAEHPEYHLLVLAEHVQVQTDTAIVCASAPAAVTGDYTAVIGDGDAGTSGYYPRKTASAYLIFE